MCRSAWEATQGTEREPEAGNSGVEVGNGSEAERESDRSSVGDLSARRRTRRPTK